MAKVWMGGWFVLVWANSLLWGQLEIPEVRTAPKLADFLGMEPPDGWEQNFLRVSGFIQREPRDGQPSSQNTEVYLCHNEHALYAVFLAFDTEPEKIRARLAPREQVFEDDSVNIQIDTFNDQRRGYTFLSTPRGIQWDGLFTEGSDFDSSYNAVWKSEGKMTDKGYMVWMEIPFKSLRFPRGGNQLWRVMFNRTIPRTNEDTFWPRYTNRIQGRLNQAAEVRLSGSHKAGRNMQFVPYGAFRSFRILDPNHPEGPRFASDDADADIGADAKFVFRDSLVLDLALNPDFSQVESDQPQITVNQRFEVFFPERRPFFLENADLFQTPFNLVFTRRIADPRAGARFTGKAGRWAFGALAMDDEAPGKRLPPDDPAAGERAGFGIIRASRDIFQQSKIGFLFTHRDFADQENQVAAMDGRILWNENWNTTWQIAHSDTEALGVSLEDQAINLSLNRSGRNVNHHIHYIEVGPEFRTQTGFLGSQRPDTRDLHLRPSYLFRPEGKHLLSWGPDVLLQRIWDFDGTRLDENLEVNAEWNFVHQTFLGLGHSWHKERLRPGDVEGLERELDFSYQGWRVSLETQWHEKWSGEILLGSGSRPNFEPAEGVLPNVANDNLMEVALTWRPVSQLRINQDLLYSELKDRNSSERIFRNRIYRSRINWQFNRELSLRMIAQFEGVDVDPELTSLERDRSWNGDVLFTYLINPWTALYAGYNSNFTNFDLVEEDNRRRIIETRNSLKEDAHQFFVKFSYLWR